MKIFMRAIWASPGVPTELQVCPWDPSFSTLVFHLWQCGGRRGVLGSDFMLKHGNTKSCFFKVLLMWTADESLLLRLALGPELEEKFWAIAGNGWKWLTLPETWWLISLSDETYPLITMTTISYYWLVSDHNWWAVESTISNIIFSPQGLRCSLLCTAGCKNYWILKVKWIDVMHKAVNMMITLL